MSPGTVARNEKATKSASAISWRLFAHSPAGREARTHLTARLTLKIHAFVWQETLPTNHADGFAAGGPPPCISSTLAALDRSSRLTPAGSDPAMSLHPVASFA